MQRGEAKGSGQRTQVASSRIANFVDAWFKVLVRQGRKPEAPGSADAKPVHLPKVSEERLAQTLTEKALTLEDLASIVRKDEKKQEEHTFLYLAYGSNLCYQTFQKGRGVTPLAQLNVQVPELRLTFDLAGIPYTEPCFANTARRDVPVTPGPPHPPEEDGQDEEDEEEDALLLNEKASPSEEPPKYHKDRWQKGLVGVVYEVSAKDYYHIIATEGGGASYTDVLVDCYRLPEGETVPNRPIGTYFKAHTLFAPSAPPPKQIKSGNEHHSILQAQSGTSRPSIFSRIKTGRIGRPDPSYAQPSARYINLLRTGADEHSLPQEYKDYLNDIRPFTITSNTQLLGQFIFLMLWFPFITLIFSIGRRFRGEDGQSPKWVKWLSNALFEGMWVSYDNFFKPLFGDGERTQDEDEEARKRKIKAMAGSPRIRALV